MLESDLQGNTLTCADQQYWS